jgi:hypothetical protein
LACLRRFALSTRRALVYGANCGEQGDQPTPRGLNNMADRKMPGMTIKGGKRYGKKKGAGPTKVKPQGPVPRKPRGTTKGKK